VVIRRPDISMRPRTAWVWATLMPNVAWTSMTRPCHALAITGSHQWNVPLLVMSARNSIIQTTLTLIGAKSLAEQVR